MRYRPYDCSKDDKQKSKIDWLLQLTGQLMVLRYHYQITLVDKKRASLDVQASGKDQSYMCLRDYLINALMAYI